jgi:ketosteroid isomerase-like protein
MSQENVEIVRRSIDAFNRGDLETAISYLHPEGEVADDPRVPGGGITHRGNTEVERYFKSLSRYWESVRYAPERFVDRGDDVLVLTRMTTHTRRGGPEIERPLDLMVTLREGRIFRVRTFSSRKEALEAAGLRE